MYCLSLANADYQSPQIKQICGFSLEEAIAHLEEFFDEDVDLGDLLYNLDPSEREEYSWANFVNDYFLNFPYQPHEHFPLQIVREGDPNILPNLMNDYLLYGGEAQQNPVELLVLENGVWVNREDIILSVWRNMHARIIEEFEDADD